MTNEEIIRSLSVRKLAVRIPMTKQLYQSLSQYPSFSREGVSMTPVEPDPVPDDDPTPDDD